MSDREEIMSVPMDAIGEEGGGVSCEEAEIFKDEDGWKMMPEGFMEPFRLGDTVEEARTPIKEYARMGFTPVRLRRTGVSVNRSFPAKSNCTTLCGAYSVKRQYVANHGHAVSL
jgi:hypothetical protein